MLSAGRDGVIGNRDAMSMEDNELDLRGLLGLLRRQLRLIVIIALVVIGIAGLAVFSLTPKYSSSAMLLVDTSQKNLLDAAAASGSVEIDSSRVDSEIEILKSPAVLLKVIDELDLVRDADFGVKLSLTDRMMAFLQISQPTLPTGEAAVAQVLADVRKAVTVDRLGDTNLITATVTSDNPTRAAEIANAWADAYIRDQVAAKVTSSLMSRDVLQARLAEARDAVAGSEGAFDQYINDSLTQIVKETGQADIVSLRDQLSSLGATQDANSKRAELAQASLQQRNWSVLAETLQSEALRELERQQRELTARIETAAAEQTVNLRAELAQIEQRMVDAAAGGLASLRQSVTAAATQQSELRQQLRSAVLGSSLSPQILSRIYELQQRSEVARAQYQTLLSRINEVEAQAALQLADSRVVSPAMPPTRPSFPNISLTLALAAVVGLGLGIGLAFLRENLVGGIVTEQQATALLHVPIVAALPRERSPGRDRDLADLMVTSALSAFPEGVRRIKANIDQAAHRRAVAAGSRSGPTSATIMVTSSTADEGKTTIALALARAYAMARHRVAIVDCDLRRPTLHRMLNLPQSSGLVDYLGGKEAPELASLVASDPRTPMQAIVGSEPSEIPTDQLVTAPAFAQLIERLRAEYDIVVLDTPPIGPVVDGLYLARMADYLVFVVRAGATSQTEARMSLEALKSAKTADAEILAVLNQQDRASASYKDKYQSYYYGEN